MQIGHCRESLKKLTCRALALRLSSNEVLLETNLYYRLSYLNQIF